MRKDNVQTMYDHIMNEFIPAIPAAGAISSSIPKLNTTKKHLMRENSDSGIWEAFMSSIPGDPKAVVLIGTLPAPPCRRVLRPEKDNWEMKISPTKRNTANALPQ
jgi:hypothetical protein